MTIIKDLKTLNIALLELTRYINLSMYYLKDIKELPKVVLEIEKQLNIKLRPYDLNNIISINNLFFEIFDYIKRVR